ncbi:BEL1-like homeodomain protein 9 [Morus notabilis]|uniref:BEL1-like homeodomain protein 9 n=1 Tax=Morus notabilis TaxID=981085 RepID=W9RZF1_9ROSA|nr:BEL1-like homeodomain protein 9 [Morus notabilis]EXC19374.1 BEL1-like homeodomain protein 9 [Morus notabilis]
MADQKSFELFQVLPLPTSSTSFPSPKHDAVSNSYPPLYQLFSDNQLHGYGAVLLPDNNKLIGCSVPLGPFTGYASILKRSSFLKPAQQLLEDFCGSGFRVLEDPSTDDLSLGHSAWANYRVAYQFKKDSRLAFMLEEVYNRCKLYCQQIQSVVTSFKAVAGLGNAAPFITSAIRAISNHFGCLKNAILGQLHFNLADVSRVNKDDGTPSLFLAPKTSFGSKPIHNFPNLRSSIWRSQRGLPEHAVAVLKKWLFEHFLHPYPTDSEKHMLARQTGLSRAQISNWFINSRVRLWKPMVEEIHVLQAQKTQIPLPDAINRNHNTPSLEKLETPISNFDNLPKGREISSKRSRNEGHDDNSSYSRDKGRSNVEAYYVDNYSKNNSSSGGSSASLALNLQHNMANCEAAAFKNWF